MPCIKENKKFCSRLVWCCIPAIRRQRWVDFWEFEDRLDYRVNPMSNKAKFSFVVILGHIPRAQVSSRTFRNPRNTAQHCAMKGPGFTGAKRKPDT